MDGSKDRSINVKSYINRLKDNNHMIISADAEKAFFKNITFFHDKNPSIIWVQKKHTTPKKVIHVWQNYSKIVLNSERLKAFPLRSGKRQEFPLSSFLFNLLHINSIHIVKVKLAQPCLTLCDPRDCSLPGSSVHEFSR